MGKHDAGEVRKDASGHRRYVTLLFSDLCDYTTLTEAIDPEDTDALRRRIEQLAARVFTKHGGAASQCYGDGILAVFGLPTSDEHAVRAAIEAALELREALPGLGAEAALPAGFELRMHFGIHSGVVFARAGDPLHGRYELTGDAVNTAARLCAAAQRDEILVSESSLSGFEPFYAVQHVPDLTLKGKRMPVPAYRVQGRSGVRTRFEAAARRGLTSFVNRVVELRQLEQAMDEVRQGGTRIVGLLGGAGIGKTRVLEEFLRTAASADSALCRGCCEGYGNVAPLQPFVQILRQLFGIDGEMPLERAIAQVESVCAAHADARLSAAALLHVLSLRSVPEDPTLRETNRLIVRAIAVLVSGLRPGPLVLVIDDWQWADDLSHQVLRGVIAAIQERGLLVLLAAREIDRNDSVLSQSQARIIPLRPLHQEDSARVIHSLLPDALDLGLTRALYRRSGGNPLFLEELCRSLPSEAAAAPAALDHDRVPDTLHGVVQARLQHLPEAQLELLRAASIIGNEFSHSVLARAIGRTDLDAVLEVLASCDLVRSIDGHEVYRFKHGIARDVIYESVRLSQRREIHAAIARMLQERSTDTGLALPHEALAHHYVGSGEHELAAHHAEQAGDYAALSSSLDRARLQYGTVLSELDKLPVGPEIQRRWLAVSVKWARAWVYNQAPEQLDVLDRSARYARELGDVDRQADVEQMSAWICYALGEQPRAIDHCRRGLLLAEKSGNVKLIGQLLSNLGQSHAAAGEYPEAIEHLDRALQLKRDRAGGGGGRAVPVGFAYALGVVATVHAEQGEFARSEAQMSEALDVVRGTGHAIEASLYALRAMMELWQGQWERCIATCVEACATAERIHGPYVFAISQAMSSHARLMLERTPLHLAKLYKAVDWLEARGMGLYLSMTHGCAAEAALAAGEYAQARDYAERALRRAERKDPFGKAAAQRVLAGLHAVDDPASPEVQACLQRALLAAEARGSRREAALTRLLRARLQLAQGDRPAARQALEGVCAELQQMGMSHHQAEAQRFLAGC